MSVRDALLAKAEALLAAGDGEARVAWDPVQGRAVRLVSAVPHLPLPKQLWAALYAAEAEAWETPRPTAHHVPSRVARADPYGLGGMPGWEKTGVAQLSGVREETRFGRAVAYLAERVLRVEDNRALQYAHRLARTAVLPLVVLAFAGRDEGSPSGAARLQCLASFRLALAALGIPLLCFAGPFCEHTATAYLRECAAHVAVCDWAPGPQPATEALVRARICPVICFDSDFWCLRAPGATAEAMAELCADRMREGRALDPLPTLGELPRPVQEMLLREGSSEELFVPAAIVRPRAALPPPPWRFGAEAAQAELARCVERLASRSDNVGAEVRDQAGPWALLQHVGSGAVSAAACLRAMLGGQVSGPQQRRAFQVLVRPIRSILLLSQRLDARRCGDGSDACAGGASSGCSCPSSRSRRCRSPPGAQSGPRRTSCATRRTRGSCNRATCTRCCSAIGSPDCRSRASTAPAGCWGALPLRAGASRPSAPCGGSSPWGSRGRWRTSIAPTSSICCAMRNLRNDFHSWP